MKSRTCIWILSALALVFGTGRCTTRGETSHRVIRGSGHTVTRNIGIEDVTGVALKCVGDLTIEIAERAGMRVEAEDNMLENIDIEIVNGILEIREREGVVLAPTRPVTIRLAVPRLESLEHTAGGCISLARIRSKRLHIRHSGSGRIESAAIEAGLVSMHLSGSGGVRCKRVEAQRCRLISSGSGELKVRELRGISCTVRITGSGDVTIDEGSAVQQNVWLSGSGEYKSADFSTSETEVMVSGSGSAFLQAADRLDVTISGGGNVHYRGRPEIERHVSGFGKLERIKQ